MQIRNNISVALIFFLIFTQYACKKDYLLRAAPDCIQEKVAEFKEIPDARRVVRYKMNGELVFFFDSPSADDGSVSFVLDMRCDIICIIGLVVTNPEMCSFQTFNDFFSDPVIIWRK